MATLTEAGIQIERLNDIVKRFEDGFKQIYGQNIDLSPNTPDGQMVGILAQIKMDIEELAENIYRQLDPDVATGTWLEQRVAYAGLTRRGASYSYLRSAILTGDPYTNIYDGLVVSDINKTRWILTSHVQLDDNGSARADFRSENLGEFNIGKNTSLTIETVTLGLNGVSIVSDSEVGAEEETDQELRERFLKLRNRTAQNSVESIESKIAALPDVKHVKVIENNTGETDSNNVKPHTINVIVDGGDSESIARVIYNNKGAGVGVQGGQSHNVVGSNAQKYPISFDRATYVDVLVELVIVRYDDFTQVSKDDIANNLANIKFNIGEDVRLSRLYSPINIVGGFYVKTLKISRRGDSFKDENINISPRELARILPSDINITVM